MPPESFILTNNPMVRDILGRLYDVRFSDMPLRDILVKARDLVYLGHTLYTHPLSGSVKPNETPFKSVVLSSAPGKMDPEHAEIMASAIAVCDKLKPRTFKLTDKLLDDFMLIDYTLLCGAIGFDAAAGLSIYNTR